MHKQFHKLFLSTGLLLVVLLPLSGITMPLKAYADPSVTEFDVPTYQSNPFNITAGPDSALWFTESTGNKIGRITTGGAITEYPIPVPTSYAPGIDPNSQTTSPDSITAGPDGALWFTEGGTNKIGRITVAGSISEFPVPSTPSTYEGLAGITSGPDGALWFTEANADKIGRITTSGAITEYVIPTVYATPIRITTGPDGDLWFAEEGASGAGIGRITTSGAITEYVLPSNRSYAYGITNGTDGALWFTDLGSNKIGRITTSGVISEYLIPTAMSESFGIATGPDGALWFPELGTNKVGRITTNGTITEYPIPTANANSYGITSGPDGTLWFTEDYTNKIGRITTPVPSVPSNLNASSPTQQPVLTWGAVSGATSYNVYRDEIKIGSSTTNSYTDMTAATGNHSYYVTAVNAAGESGPSNSVTVMVGAVPLFTSAASLQVNARAQTNFTVTASGSPAATITESGALPNGLSFHDNADGTASLSGQASPINQGYYFLTFTAMNSLGSASQSFVLSVNNAPTIPTFIGADSAVAAYGVPFTITISTTGYQIPNITKSGGLPNGLKLTDNDDGTVTISGTIKGNQTTGSDTFSLKAKNKNGTATESFTITW